MQQNPSEATADRLSPATFAEMFEAAYGRLCGLAAAMVGNRGDAEDLVQEAALVALNKLDDFAVGTNFNAWMARIVRMHAFNWRRKKQNRRTAATDPVTIDQSQVDDSPETMNPDEVTDSFARAAAGDVSIIADSIDDNMLNSFRHLDETARACLLLRVVHDLSYDEISAMIDIPPGTAMSHVHRSKRRLRENLTNIPESSA